MTTPKYHLLMSAEETAKILGVTLNRLYKVCADFDKRNDDQWDLVEGIDFEWLNKQAKTRRFYEEGAMAIAKYIQETDTSGIFGFLIDNVIERLTNRRRRIREMLVRRRVIAEVPSLEGIILRGDLVFIDRPRAIRILQTNGKGLNAAAKREQDNNSLDGREQFVPGEHYDEIDNAQYWSQRGLVRIATNMSENLVKKSRKAWVSAVAEVYEDAIEQQRKYLESLDTKVQKAMTQAKTLAKGKCQVTLEKLKPHEPFDLHVHHLFDRATRPDIAALHENLLVMHEDLHNGFHRWHKGKCEPKHFVEYLTTVEAWRFETPQKLRYFHHITNRLEKLQKMFEGHYVKCQLHF